MMEDIQQRVMTCSNSSGTIDINKSGYRSLSIERSLSITRIENNTEYPHDDTNGSVGMHDSSISSRRRCTLLISHTANADRTRCTGLCAQYQ